MLDFSFTEEQEEFRKILREFARSELLPNYMRWDREAKFPRELWRKMGELGLTGLRVPVNYDGSGADCITAGIAAEEIGRGDFNLTYAVMLNSLIGEILTQHASEDLKREWLPPMARGEKVIGIAITEPGAGSDAAALRTRAERRGEFYVISGEKSGISVATVADAFIVFAKTSQNQGAKGVSAFLIPADLPGIERKGYEDMGNIPIGRGSIVFDNVKIPVQYRIGDEDKGFYQIMNGFDLSRILIGLQCLGTAAQSLDETVEYVKNRYAFGQPIAKFEGVSFPIATHYSQLELVRWQCYRGLWLRDKGKSHTMIASMCKWLGPKVAREAIHECILLNGHYGYTKDLPLEQRLRDVIGLEIGDGTAQIQKIVIARELLGREFKPY